MGMIRNWLDKRAAAKAKDQYKEGYNLAAGWLLRNERTVKEVEDMSDNSSAFGEGNVSRSFDRGMSDALTKLLAVGAIEDTRVHVQ